MLYDFDSKFNPDVFDHLSDYEDDEADRIVERDNYQNVNKTTLQIPTPPLSPNSAEMKDWLTDDVAASLSSDNANSGGFQKSQNVDFLDDYDFVKLLEKTADYAEYLVEMQSFVKAEMRDKNCLWSLQCANWKNGDCRHCKRCIEADESPIYSSGVEWSPNLSTPSSGLVSEVWPSLIEVADNAAEFEEKVTTLSYPMCDHSYHLKRMPSAPPPSPETEDLLGLDTPSASDSDTEIDVVSVTPTTHYRRSQKRRHINTVRTPPGSHRLVSSSSDTQTKSTKNSSYNKAPAKRSKLSPTLTKPTTTVKSTARCRDSDDSEEQPLTLTLKRVYTEEKSEHCAKRTKREKSTKSKEVIKYTTKSKAKNCNKMKSASRSGNRADLTPEERERRSEHNEMEKKRRKELVKAYHYLKKLLNMTCEGGRSSRVAILRNARECNLKLVKRDSELTNLKAIEEKRHEELTARLKELKKQQRKVARLAASPKK